MADATNTLPDEVLLSLSQTLSIPKHALLATISLLDEGGTVPFIARYRKEATGALDEVQIRTIEERLSYLRDLLDRRATILKTIAEQGRLTDDLHARIQATLDRAGLEDLYLPYRPKRRTKATIARENGLEPLADYIWNQQTEPRTMLELASEHLCQTVSSVADALEGARHIVAERISEQANVRKLLRQVLHDEGVIVVRRTTDTANSPQKDEQQKFKQYYDYCEPVSTIPSHRMLAIRRGEAESVLYFLIKIDPLRPKGILRRELLGPTGDWTSQLELSIDDAWTRLLSTSIQGELRLELKRRSDEAAIQVFRDNLANLLLAAPAGPIAVLGLDPGLRTGCKLAVVDETGKFLAHDVIYPHTGQTKRASEIMANIVRQHHVRAIAIGNGTASRETDSFVSDFLAEHALSNTFKVMVSESGASIYSASDIARQEFPNLDLTVRGAISIARRLQDPLSELVKVDPKSIGVGQYQHDVDQRALQATLEATIENCVNKVGVDLNTSSWTLLRYVAGITERTALAIVKFRDENGRFQSREELKKVPGVGAKTFEQAAGFLRIRGGSEPMDATAVHPESYSVVQDIAAAVKATIAEIIAAPALLDGLDHRQWGVGAFTIADILQELRKPGRDPRDLFLAPVFHEGVRELADVQPDMVLEGVVTNVTKFGAFVDIGVHQDGLIHISELSNRYVRDPAQVVKAGQIVRVKVLSADTMTKRIALSMKALITPLTPSTPKSASPMPAANPVPRTMEDKLSVLSSRWTSNSS